MQRCSSDVETLRVFLSSDVVEIGRSILLILTVTPILFWLDARLAWVSLCLIPFIGLFAYIFFNKVQQVYQVTDEAEAAMTGVLQENLTGIRVVRAFARQEYEIAKFAERSGRTSTAVRARLEKEGALERIRAGIAREKTMDWLVGKANVIG